MNKNLLLVLTFFVVLVGLFWLMPNTKIDIIGDFFEKLITPICLTIAAPFTIKKISKGIKNYRSKKTRM